MKCIFCGSDQSKVIDKRAVKGSGEIRRRRECLKCHRRFTTYERVGEIEFYVIKRDGKRQVFDLVKLRSGIAKSLEKRPLVDQVDGLTARIERKLRAKGKNEVSTKLIGQLVLLELKKIDKVAYLRFASVYRHFEDTDDFARELQSLGQIIKI
ncbi:transcriptional regulator NrdR [Candidatus Daviesbacteria bacterium RIFCSPHIGHO2_01_FULL_44_29]|uniref:Transcriptional repressor NrdR n=1 Tax=Candidatus Daviesbacteria bacterium RIFCSPHIGHO2_02_FULL_43_12 TaxID=1797776 RepID=A0A1F5KKL6_9BACT|nr:MAG: transcriptional regulator NrdR [Candidatus Daviesbacteria bacterium RIFCSPHIGHO2_01_FULL_44_29]OGE40287.1 MAG: transcriptional regulator NrdR [Candidatus Daviesbacteria bacterium RIFCSPHIGHO2_12_FULL_47_45]OGE41414.1 MAG: transcriptional regulator NrdR [Candidatus Daviesbacteria bacterium RIFCSPHIGHO2_02_FULL_43_12]OGE69614.1 MAG: transcriptional regulator NrdR [Candidatus Daviesbacteria bacterium RIFCSPLOWO2_01_FULL_43_15]